MGVEKITKRISRKVTENIVVKKKNGNKTYLLKDEEAYIVATSEINGAHGLPIYVQNFTGKLQQVLYNVGQQIIGNRIKPASEQRYYHRSFHCVNINEEGEEGKKQKTGIGMINVLGLSHNN